MNEYKNRAQPGAAIEVKVVGSGPIGPKGPPGDTPYIGDNGNWWVSGQDTGVSASGQGVGGMEAAVYDPTGKAQDVFGYADDAIAGLPVKRLVGTAESPIDLDTLTELGRYYLSGELQENSDNNWNAVKAFLQIGVPVDVMLLGNNGAMQSVNGITIGAEGAFFTRFLANGNWDNFKITRLMPASGGTLTGPLTLPSAPAEDMQAANKGYVDAAKQAAMDASRPADWVPTAEDVGAAVPSESTPVTLTAANWTGSGPYTQTVSVAGLSADANGDIGLAQSATAEQRAAAREAMISVTGQAVGSLTVTADGEMPTVDIPISITLLG